MSLLDWARVNFKREFGPLGKSRHGVAVLLLLLQIAQVAEINIRELLTNTDLETPMGWFNYILA
jgi:hypothetical protein